MPSAGRGSLALRGSRHRLLNHPGRWLVNIVRGGGSTRPAFLVPSNSLSNVGHDDAPTSNTGGSTMPTDLAHDTDDRLTHSAGFELAKRRAQELREPDHRQQYEMFTRTLRWLRHVHPDTPCQFRGSPVSRDWLIRHSEVERRWRWRELRRSQAAARPRVRRAIAPDGPVCVGRSPRPRPTRTRVQHRAAARSTTSGQDPPDGECDPEPPTVEGFTHVGAAIALYLDEIGGAR
jgi:hypothetical protein